MSPPPVTSFTRDDHAQSKAYLSHRLLLYQMWDLALTYPNVASRVSVSIRKADPRADYRYDADSPFADCAIVVTLTWANARETCDFLSCTATYPRGEHCRPGDEPRVFPSGDSTTATACEPSCFMISDSRTAHGGTLVVADVAPRYDSDSAMLMSARTGEFSRRAFDGKRDDAKIPAVAASDDPRKAADAVRRRDQRLPDIGQLNYSPETDSCEVVNAALYAYVTQPHERATMFSADSDGGEKPEVCRLTNFIVGDDIAENVPVTLDGEVRRVVSGRHSSSYCAGFDKLFDPVARTCYESWWDRVLSYTFVGSALVRLARHAAAGGDRCDRLLPTDAKRAEINVVDDVKPERRSRSHWFHSVDRSWTLPPPNVLLSDLGVSELGVVWCNANGGVTRAATAADYEESRRGRRAAMSSAVAMAKRLLAVEPSRARRHVVDSTNVGVDDDEWQRPFTGHVVASNGGGDSGVLLDFDSVYDETTGKRGSDMVRELINELGIAGGYLAAEETARALVGRLTRSAYNRVLRYLGRDFAGSASRTLLGLGVRVTTGHMVSSVLSRFTTRMMLALATTASGVGFAVGVFEMLTALLDFMMAFGWDPGNYQSEFTNDVYDDFALGWLRQQRHSDVASIDPYVVLSLFRRDLEGAVVPDGGGGGDASMGQRGVASDDGDRFALRDRGLVPWFFRPFERAVNSIVNDATDVVDDGEGDDRSRDRTETRVARRKFTLSAASKVADPLSRTRPIISDNLVTTSMLLTTHYFAHRSSNSLGQRVDLGERVNVNDALVTDAVRDNELAALLSSAYSRREIPRDMLLGAARRNIVAKTTNVALSVFVAAGCAWTLAVCALLGFFRSSRRTNGGPVARSSDAVLGLVFTVSLFVVPLIVVMFVTETIVRDRHDRTYDRASANDLDAMDRFCDAVTNVLSTDNGGGLGGEFLRDALRQELRVVYDM